MTLLGHYTLFNDVFVELKNSYEPVPYHVIDNI